MNSSCDRRLATWCNQARSSFRPPSKSSASNSAALALASAIAMPISPGGEDSDGTMTSNGTTARSCSSSTPTMRRP